MTILNYLVAGAAIIAVHGMLVVSYIVIKIVRERKQIALCMDSEPCKHRIDKCCSIQDRVLKFTMEIVGPNPEEKEEMLVKFHCDKREES